jgi:hypothetical protein
MSFAIICLGFPSSILDAAMRFYLSALNPITGKVFLRGYRLISLCSISSGMEKIISISKIVNKWNNTP